MVAVVFAFLSPLLLSVSVSADYLRAVAYVALHDAPAVTEITQGEFDQLVGFWFAFVRQYRTRAIIRRQPGKGSHLHFMINKQKTSFRFAARSVVRRCHQFGLSGRFKVSQLEQFQVAAAKMKEAYLNMR